MSRRRTLVIVLALVHVWGIVGMLLVDGLADGFFFALAALPLGVGGYRALTMRGVSAVRD